MMVVATSLPTVPLVVAIAVMGLFMVGMSGRMVPAMAMILGSIEPRRRGSFMSVNSSVQHISAAIGAYAGGLIVTEAADGSLVIHYSRVGWLAAAISAVALVHGSPDPAAARVQADDRRHEPRRRRPGDRRPG